MRLNIIAAVGLALAPSVAVVAGAHRQRLYHVTDLGALGYNSSAYDLNDTGHVVGSTQPPGAGSVAFLWRPSTGMESIGAFPRPGYRTTEATAYAINNSAVVVGVSRGANGLEAFIRTAEHGMVGLGDFSDGPFGSRAIAVNDAGYIVGTGTRGTTDASWSEAAMWTPDREMIGLGDLPGGALYSGAGGINNLLQVVGASTGSTGTQGFIWDPENGMQPMPPTPWGVLTHGTFDINDAGQMCGRLTNAVAFFYDPQTGYEQIGLFANSLSTTGVALNEHGEVVGQTTLFDPWLAYRGWVWDAQRGLRMLDECLAAGSVLPGWEQFIVSAYGINERGQIAGQTVNIAILLTPFTPADVNCDGVVDAFDIDPFVAVLADPDAHEATQWDCPSINAADVNQDGRANNFDIDPFVAALLMGG
ncbi:MAG: dockerin type I domain-containing protein [Phycisphaerae bacterium]